MLEINQREKVVSVFVAFIVSFFLSPFISEIIFGGGYYYFLDVAYYFSKLHYALFMPLYMPFGLIFDILSKDGNNNYYIVATIATSIIIVYIILQSIYILRKINKGFFRSNLTKWLNYVLLSLCFETWFVIGLIPAGMEKI